MKSLQLTKDLYYVGIQDPGLRIFDIIMLTEFGTSYNSYLLKGSEKTALFEAGKVKFNDAYLEKLRELTKIEDIDYIIMDHTEPDHSGSIEKLLELNPGIKIVGSSTGINFLKKITNRDFNSVIVKDKDTLSLGNKTLNFISAPNLHWPDTQFTYVPEEKALFSCDAFGAHYALEGITNDKIADQADYNKSVKYYFDMIIGPFKSFALAAVKKVENLEIDILCTGHGPVLIKEPKKVIEAYKQWAVEINPNTKKTVIIPYVSAYGYTGELADKIAEGVKAAGDMEVRTYDLVSADPNKVSAEIYWADGLLFGTPTFIGEALKPIWDLTTGMLAKTHGGKIASAFGSYGWSGEGVPHIIERLRQLNLKVFHEGYRVRFKPSEAEIQGAYEFGYNFGKSVLAGKIIEPIKEAPTQKLWKCLVCGELVPGAAAPAACPVCGAGPEQFVPVDAEIAAFKSEEAKSIIIIGNGAAGTAAAEAIRSRNRVCSVEMISEEPVLGYNRPMMTKGLLSDMEKLNLYIKPESWYVNNTVKTTLGVKVTELRPETKELVLSNGEIRQYDKLILATGAKSVIPATKGSSLSGVFAIRSLEDVHKIQAYLPKVDKVVLLGGGILGMEAAWELKKAKKDVTIVERGSRSMSKQLDEKGSRILEEAIKKADIHLIQNATVDSIVGSSPDSETGQVTGVKLTDGKVLAADMVIFSMGIKSNIELTVGRGIETTACIVVNEKMETNISDIYACGDCANFHGVNYGIWSQALGMGKVAGANATGDSLMYKQITPLNSFVGMGTSLFSVGDNGKDADKKYKTFEIFDQSKDIYEKMYFENDRFCGGILIGDVSKAVKFSKAYENQESLEKMLAL